MFHNTPNGLQIETEQGWTISVSLAGEDAKEDCEIAVWPVGLGDQKNWVRWGANGEEPPETDYPIYSRVLQRLTSSELIRIINRLAEIKVEPNKWLSRSLGRETIWR